MRDTVLRSDFRFLGSLSLPLAFVIHYSRAMQSSLPCITRNSSLPPFVRHAIHHRQNSQPHRRRRTRVTPRLPALPSPPPPHITSSLPHPCRLLRLTFPFRSSSSSSSSSLHNFLPFHSLPPAVAQCPPLSAVQLCLRRAFRFASR